MPKIIKKKKMLKKLYSHQQEKVTFYCCAKFSFSQAILNENKLGDQWERVIEQNWAKVSKKEFK